MTSANGIIWSRARLGIEVNMAFGDIDSTGYNTDLEYETLHKLVVKANRSSVLLQTQPEHAAYRHVLHRRPSFTPD